MTTLFRLEPIATFEEVEQMPDQALLISARHDHAPTVVHGCDAEKFQTLRFLGYDLTALVPVDAEEETIDDAAVAEPHRYRSRYVTEWETTGLRMKPS